MYALLSNGRGKHRFGLALYIIDGGVERRIAGPAFQDIDLGQDPVLIHGLPIPHVRAIFEKAGQYTFGLHCDEQRIAEYHFEVE